MSKDMTEATRIRAYHIWERDGRPQGRDAEHWAEAELSPAKLGAAKSPKRPVKALAAKPVEAKLSAKSPKRAKPATHGLELHVH